MHKRLEPKLFTILRKGYSKQQFSSDLTAGIIVGIVALPLAIAFAIASGVRPEQGLYTAIIAGLTVSILGGSRVQIGGPTGAFIIIIYSIVQQCGYDGLAVATFIAGVLLILMGIAKLGTLLKFIPYPLTVGFTSGIALLIFSTQIKDFLGLRIENVPAEFIEKWITYGMHINTFDYYTLGIGLLSLFIIIIWPKITNKIPGSLVAILATTLLVYFLNIQVDTIGSRFGNVPNTLPIPRLPHVSLSLVRKMFSPAVTIALLAAIESLLSAVVADGMLGSRHRSNMELIAQGAANILSPLFGGIPATGAIARTAMNIKSGGRTPVAGIIHAITLLLIMVFFAKWAALIPMPTLAAILIFVAYNMSEWHSFVKTLKSPKNDVIILLSTFFLTVLIDLTVAIEVGIVLASLLFLRSMAKVTKATLITKDLQEDEEQGDDSGVLVKRIIPSGVEIFEIQGALFFAAVDQFKETIREVGKKTRVLILNMQNMFTIDATGLQALEDILKRTTKEGTAVLFSGVRVQPLAAMQRSGFMDRIGEENVYDNINDALDRARHIVGLKGINN